jgi:hypothetical protein
MPWNKELGKTFEKTNEAEMGQLLARLPEWWIIIHLHHWQNSPF